MRVYQSIQAMTSSLAWRPGLEALAVLALTFNDANSVSLQALYQQLARGLIEAVMPYSGSASRNSLPPYWATPCRYERSARPFCSGVV